MLTCTQWHRLYTDLYNDHYKGIMLASTEADGNVICIADIWSLPQMLNWCHVCTNFHFSPSYSKVFKEYYTCFHCWGEQQSPTRGVNPNTSCEPLSLSQEHCTSAHCELMYVWSVEHVFKCKCSVLLYPQKQMAPPPSSTTFPSPSSQK